MGPEMGNWGEWLRSWEGQWRDFDWSWSSAWNAQASEPIEQSLSVEEAATLAVEVPVGDITVKTGPAGQVKVEGVKRAYGATEADARQRLDDIQVRIEQSGDKVWVRVSGQFTGGSGGRSPGVDLTITVPQETTLSADMGVGRLQVSGTRGDVTIDAEVGEVILTDVLPSEKLSLKTRVAGVEFSGALVPNGTYEFTTDIGKIDMRLPEESTFRIDARSDIGDVNVGFTVAGRSSRDALVGKEVQGEVGENPTTSLYLRSRVGEISVAPGR
jgi:hypothetical protein